ncbi:MAG: hypothetical protein DRQ52_09755 [Gammaproteobacteria bacterium]|nr:MAG: hypothetical protein DRQ52_09755 [Gammaproteobacteria bacterium]
MNFKNFNLHQLVIFEAIWVARNLTRAAETLHMTQPGVSAALTRLRSSLNDPLFIWDGTNMNPTPRAHQLAPKIHALLADFDDVIQNTPPDIADTDREFMLVSVDYVFAGLGSRLLRRFRDQAPGARLRMTNVDLAMFEHSERFGVDLMIAPDMGFSNQNMEMERLYEDAYVGIAAVDNPLVRTQPGIDEFALMPKIYFNSSAVGIANHENMALEHGISDHSYTLLTYSYLTIPFLLQHSDCVAMVPLRVANLLLKGTDIKVFELPQAVPPLTVNLYWPSRLTGDREHQWLRDQVRAAAAE